jgi:glycerol-1-phosphatase
VWQSNLVAELRTDSEILAGQYDAALLDLDGVVYVGQFGVPGVIDALNTAHDQYGIALTCVTNNAARSSASVAEHLQELGLEVDEADVVTSAQAGAAELAKLLPAGSSVFDLMAEVELVGMKPSQEFHLDYDAVIQGYWPDMPWRMLGQAAGILGADNIWVATNMDLTIPTQWGTSPGNGTMVNALTTATGRKPHVVAGKPEAPLMLASIERTGATRPIVIGDRLDTDILGANRIGIDSLLVFSGVTSVAELVEATPEYRPTFVSWSAAGILDSHAGVTLGDEAVSAGLWQVFDGELSGSGDSLDAIRAVAVAVWNDYCTAAQGIAALEGIGLDVKNPPVSHH